MIAQHVIECAATLRQIYQSARPFKHLCIDGFLELEAAETALADFPAFDATKAVNEYGEVGRKAVNTRLADISAFYARLYAYILSPHFLAAMSAISGIDDLIADPTMYGGGTHENLNGQELDPHVDFNYVHAGDAHRRMNLLIYLNKDWDSRWGGDIELHSDPRNPDRNEIKSFRVDFNRAVLFETNEHSWHGFPLIDLPAERRSNQSRKCISIYLYSRTRPAEEAAGSHGTFYVQRPLSQRFQAGYTLSAADVIELKAGYRKRDRYIEQYQRQEERVGRERQEVGRYLDEILAATRLPTLGYALQRRLIDGKLWPDGWIGAGASFEMHAVRALAQVVMAGYLPESGATASRIIELAVAGSRTSVTLERPGPFTVTLPVNIGGEENFILNIRCDRTFVPRENSSSNDDRALAFLVLSISFDALMPAR